MSKPENNYYVTTSIPYINGEPHVGHTFELLAGDVLARYARNNGRNVIFSTGTDEHGSKIQEKADELKQPVKQYADMMSQRWREIGPSLNLSNNRFIRTTDAAHEQRAQLIWKELQQHIYKSTYSGWYCVGCETFVPESAAKENDGVCPIHRRDYEKLEEENYFFSLSSFSEKLDQEISSGRFKIVPDFRKNEIKQVLNEGLQDISVSRPKSKLTWGIAVPGDDRQVMYVWFEALMNYLTVLGYPEHEDFKNFWPADVQVIGKDIIRFHALIWPAMLIGLGLELPKTLYVHGFINIEGQKVSKSLGNVIHPSKVIELHGVDALRYFVMRHTPSYDDGDFTWKKFEDSYNNELANELGNAVSRTAAMINLYQKGVIGEIPPPEHDSAHFHDSMAECRFDQALDHIWEQVRGLNQYVEEQKPWAVAKENDSERLAEILAYMTSSLIEIADLLAPFMPETSVKIKKVFESGVVKHDQAVLFPKNKPDEQFS